MSSSFSGWETKVKFDRGVGGEQTDSLMVSIFPSLASRSWIISAMLAYKRYCRISKCDMIATMFIFTSPNFSSIFFCRAACFLSVFMAVFSAPLPFFLFLSFLPILLGLFRFGNLNQQTILAARVPFEYEEEEPELEIPDTC